MAAASRIILFVSCLGNHTALCLDGNVLIRHERMSQRKLLQHVGADERTLLGNNYSQIDYLPTPERSSGEDERNTLKGKTLKIITLNDWPLSEVKMNKTSQMTYGDGIAFRFIELLSSEFGFNYTLLPTEGNSAKNVINMVKKGEADIGAAFLPSIFSERLSYSTTLAIERWVVLLLRPQESASGSSLLAPFDTTVWALILLSVSIVGPVIYAIMFVRVRLCRGSPRLSKVFSLTSCIWFVYGALMRQGSTLNPVSDSSRLLFATWWIFITVVTAFYTANLTAFLTLSRFTLPIDGPLDIAKNSYQWIGHGGSIFEKIVYEDNAYVPLRDSVDKGFGQFLNSSDEDLLNLVRKGAMFIREKRVAERLLFRDYLKEVEAGTTESDRCTFAITPQPFLSLPVGFIFPENSSLPKLFNPMLISLVEAGIVDHLMQSDLPRSEICPLNLGSNGRQLRNTDLITTYQLVGMGLLVAAAVFMGEYTLKYCMRCVAGKFQQPIDQKTKQESNKEKSMFPWISDKWMRAIRRTMVLQKMGKGRMNAISGRSRELEGETSVYNGREYIKVYSSEFGGLTVAKLIPIRAPSAALFERVYRGGEKSMYSRQDPWKSTLDVI